jgi:hypothetical protein
VVSALVAGAASALHAAPQIRFDKEQLSFGKVQSGQPINATFAFTNVGDADLEITNVKPGCGCTKAEAAKKSLAPGESSTIDAVFNSTGYRGPINKSVYVTTNDPAHTNVTLSLTADIVTIASISPEFLNFGSISVNGTRTHVVRVIPTDPKTFAITKVQAQGTHASVPSFKKVDAPTGAYWELFVVVKAGATPGRVMDWLAIMTNGGKTATLTMQVIGNVIE